MRGHHRRVFTSICLTVALVRGRIGQKKAVSLCSHIVRRIEARCLGALIYGSQRKGDAALLKHRIGSEMPKEDGETRIRRFAADMGPRRLNQAKTESAQQSADDAAVSVRHKIHRTSFHFISDRIGSTARRMTQM